MKIVTGQMRTPAIWGGKPRATVQFSLREGRARIGLQTQKRPRDAFPGAASTDLQARKAHSTKHAHRGGFAMIERWLVAIRDHPNRPAPAQCLVLQMLALRMDWHTGRGYASVRQLGSDAGASERTVRRGISWARETGHLARTRRGHRVSSQLVIASEWQLTTPGYPQAESQPVTGDLLGKPTGQNGRPNRPIGATQHGQWSTTICICLICICLIGAIAIRRPAANPGAASVRRPVPPMRQPQPHQGGVPALTADRLALATRVMKARRSGICPSCRGPIIIGQRIARLTSPPAWIHLVCVEAVRKLAEGKR